MSRNSKLVGSTESNGGIYGFYYNEMSGNFFAKLMDGNRPNNPVRFCEYPHRIPGTVKSFSDCSKLVSNWAK